MGRKLKRVCIDCNSRLKNRSKNTKRCRVCDISRRKMTSKGRQIGVFCIKCGEELSIKKSKSLLCILCYRKNPVPCWRKGKTGFVAWNKGKSLFKNEQDKVLHKNELRRIRYSKLSAKEKIADRIRTLIRNTIRYKTNNRKKSSMTTELLGCEIDFFIRYLEQLFMSGMNWSNYGNGEEKWNIDHIKPLSSFDLSDSESQKAAFHFTNCRPMWSIDNIKKGNKVL